MPTGYTRYVEEDHNLTFKEFTMLCARAFGACVTMRDDPLTDPIPEEFQVSTYYQERLDQKIAELERLNTTPRQDLFIEFEKEKTNDILRSRERIKERIDLAYAYDRLTREINAWTAPTESHDGLKVFMLKQIDESKNFDCSTNFYFEHIQELESTTFETWLEKKIESAKSSITSHRDQVNREKEAVASRNLWIKQLRESLEKM